jgi:hypothetical protein
MGTQYSVESQLAGVEVGGIQLEIAPRFKRNVEFYTLEAGEGSRSPLQITATPRELGLEAGRMLLMKPLSDPNFTPPRWDWENRRPDPFDGWKFEGLRSEDGSQRTKGSSSGAKKGRKGWVSNRFGEPYNSNGPDVTQPPAHELKVGHPELARPAYVSDLFAASKSTFGTPLIISPLPLLNMQVNVTVSEELQSNATQLPADFTVHLSVSPFEDVESFRVRVEHAVLQASPRFTTYFGSEVLFDHKTRIELEDKFLVMPCYVPIGQFTS